MYEFKERFIERYSKFTDFNKFKEYSLKDPRKSFRVNTLKTSIPEIKKRLKEFKLKQIPWCKEGFFVNAETVGLGNLVEYSLGYIYIQESMSMLPVEILKPKRNEMILDIAAAPGSKTTQMGIKMKNTGLIVANDINYLRLKSLVMNIERCGLTNVAVSMQEGRFFKGFEFDKILLDAPCSGTGTIRKSPRTILEWGPNLIKKMAGIQRQLIRKCYENLRIGGEMVYSTCSLEPEENEGVVDYLINNFDVKILNVDVDVKKSKPVLEFEDKKFSSELKKSVRVSPQDNDTDGFFVCRIRKA